MKSQQTIDREQLILNRMINDGVISENIPLEISVEMIDHYCLIYDTLFTTGKGNQKKSNKRFARKLAALTIMDFYRNNFSDQVTNKSKNPTLKCGFIYIISNPSFPGTVKVGLTKDIVKRLDTYQTYDPYRKFKIEHYEFCEDVCAKERYMLDQFSIDLYKGEWIDDKREDIKKVLFDYWPKAN